MNYLFIVTHGRSGSTALMKALNALPGYCILGETAGSLRPMDEALEIARANDHWHTTDYTPGDPWFGANLGHPERLKQRLARGLVQDVLAPPDGTEVAGFKEIRYMADEVPDYLYWPMMRFLLFGLDGPGRIVLLTRDAATTARSGWFRTQDYHYALDHVTRTHARLRQTAEAFPKRTFLLDHDRFAHDARGLRPLMDWLGAAPADHVLQEALAPRLTHAAEPKDD